MSEPLDVALVALAGVALGGLLAGWFQRINTKTLVAAEMDKLRLQLDGEAKKRLVGRKQDWLLELVPELVSAADPELHAQFDYKRVVVLIQRIELLLDPKVPTEARLNMALANLGFAVQAAVSGQRDISRLLNTQAEVTEATRGLLRHL